MCFLHGLEEAGAERDSRRELLPVRDAVADRSEKFPFHRLPSFGK